MVDDSWHVPEPFKNHPQRNPYGTLGYEFGVLTTDQQRLLNILKLQTIRDDHIYLSRHPEVKAIICLLLRAIFNKQPENVIEFARNFMKHPDLRDIIVEFLKDDEKSVDVEYVLSEEPKELKNKERKTFPYAVFPSRSSEPLDTSEITEPKAEVSIEVAETITKSVTFENQPEDENTMVPEVDASIMSYIKEYIESHITTMLHSLHSQTPDPISISPTGSRYLFYEGV